MARFFAFTDRILLGLSGLMVGAVFVLTCLQVTFRYFLHEPLVWAEEAVRYLFVWGTFIATAVLAGRGEHYSMPELVDVFPPLARRMCVIVVTLLCVVFCLAVIWYGTQWAWRLGDADTPVLEFPQGAVYAILPISAAYMALHLLIAPPPQAKGEGT
jgi:TRAP-type C4-dicarboxylate transport system permease small subunit